MDPKDVKLREVLFEFQQVGSYVRVTAVCAWSNTEITMVGDPMRKLKYVIAKNITKRDSGSIIA